MNGRNGEPIVAEHNGYVGKAYGVSSYAIRDPRGKEVFRTGFTTFPVDTEEKTKERLAARWICLLKRRASWRVVRLLTGSNLTKKSAKNQIR